MPLVAAHVGDRVGHAAGRSGSTGLISRNRVGMRGVNLKRVAGVVTIHAERRDQQRAVDADRVHGSDHLVAGDLGRAVENAGPGTARVVAFVGVNLCIQCRHDCQSSMAAILLGRED